MHNLDFCRYHYLTSIRRYHKSFCYANLFLLLRARAQTHKHIFTFILILQLRYTRDALQFFAYIPGAIWTTQHLTDSPFTSQNLEVFPLSYVDHVANDL